jgi:hypothetical protein
MVIFSFTNGKSFFLQCKIELFRERRR